MTSTSKQSAEHAQRLGRRTRTALALATCGTFVSMALYMVVVAFVTISEGVVGSLSAPPPWLFALPAFVPAGALVVYWRPAYRGPDSLFLTRACAFMLGLLGGGWGSIVAPVLGVLTIVGSFLAPRDRNRSDGATE